MVSARLRQWAGWREVAAACLPDRHKRRQPRRLPFRCAVAVPPGILPGKSSFQKAEFPGCPPSPCAHASSGPPSSVRISSPWSALEGTELDFDAARVDALVVKREIAVVA